MSETIQEQLGKYQLVTQLPEEQVQVPTFLKGGFGRLVYTLYDEQRRTTFEGNSALKLQWDEANQVVTGSSFFDPFLVNQIVGGILGGKTPQPQDITPEILQMIEGAHYVDLKAGALRSTKDSWNSRNNGLAQRLSEHVDLARLEREPALITGLQLQPFPEDTGGYGLDLMPKEGEFNVHYDDRLLEKWNQYKFTQTDEFGLPSDLDKTKGTRTWYTRKDGFSRLGLDGGLDLDSDRDNLGSSDSDGRVVICAEGANAKK
jgi:hypothetical protein